MYHTYTICSLAEERSRGRVLDPISMGCGFVPHLKHCVVFLNMTLNILCSVLVSPNEVGGILFWCRPSVHPSVCLSTCPSRNIPTYLLVRFDAFSAWMDSTMDSPKCGSRGEDRGSGPPPEDHKLYIFYRNNQLEPPCPEKVGPPPPWKMLEPLRNLEKWWFSLILTICDCKLSWGLKRGLSELFCQIDLDPPPPPPRRKFLDPRMTVLYRISFIKINW